GLAPGTWRRVRPDEVNALLAVADSTAPSLPRRPEDDREWEEDRAANASRTLRPRPERRLKRPETGPDAGTNDKPDVGPAGSGRAAGGHGAPKRAAGTPASSPRESAPAARSPGSGAPAARTPGPQDRTDAALREAARELAERLGRDS